MTPITTPPHARLRIIRRALSSVKAPVSTRRATDGSGRASSVDPQQQENEAEYDDGDLEPCHGSIVS